MKNSFISSGPVFLRRGSNVVDLGPVKEVSKGEKIRNRYN